VLIHAGSGGVGQAAIAVALSRGCEVYTTVSSEEKKAFLQARFPGRLPDDRFANSRSCDFEQHILSKTKGRGVDAVLNSLSDDKLQASVRCLAQHGRFLEIGTCQPRFMFRTNMLEHWRFQARLTSPTTASWACPSF